MPKLKKILLSTEIDLYYLQNFLTDDECTEILSCATVYDRSLTVNGIDDSRTSYSCTIDKYSTITLGCITRRIAKILPIDVSNIEPYQVVRYESGQKFDAHYDWGKLSKIGDKQRQYTIFAYLNDVPNGGQTVFPELGLEFAPSRGSALLWRNCDDNKIGLTKNLHQGMPPIDCTKYGLNIWIDFP